ncbi:MAG: hypothetical protein ACI8P9_001041 [Parasphingorhabdus sp.]|jgi:hypothetical protein
MFKMLLQIGLSRRIVGLLLIVMISLSGCISFDPYTVSTIENDTNASITVKLVLDMHRYGLDDESVAREYAPDWFKEFNHGVGVSMINTDPATLSAVYKIEPGGYLVAHESLGRSPYFKFFEIIFTVDENSSTFQSLEVINGLFTEVDEIEDNVYKLFVSDL